jgi:hypothetical protein
MTAAETLHLSLPLCEALAEDAVGVVEKKSKLHSRPIAAHEEHPS